MQILITNDGRPILQHVTVSEALAFVAGYDLVMRPAVQKDTETRRRGDAENKRGSGRKPQSAIRIPQSPDLPGILDQVPPRPLTATVPRTDRKPHAKGTHPLGPAILAELVGRLEKKRGKNWMARKLGVSTGMIRHWLLGDRGTSPLTLDKIFLLLDAENIVISATDGAALRTETAARSHRLPKAWRNAQ